MRAATHDGVDMSLDRQGGGAGGAPPSDGPGGTSRDSGVQASSRGADHGPGQSLRVLVVSPDLPYPPNWGFARRVFNLARELGRHHSVTLLSYIQAGEEGAAMQLQSFVDRLVTVPKPLPDARTRRREQMLSLASLTPYHAASLRSRSLQRALDDILSDDDYDVVQIESSQLAWLRVPEGMPVVIDEHNIESELLGRLSEAGDSRARRVYNRWEEWRYRRFEGAAWASAAGCATTSERDAATLRARDPEATVAVVPNSVDLEELAPQDREPDPDHLLFLGVLNYWPNLDGITYFVDEILPLIRRDRPGTQLTIVGGGTEEVLASLRRPGVTTAGWVPDIRPYLAAASVAVVPLRVGGGTRLKLVDALAMGTAVVSTTVGAEGVDVVSGEHLLLADDPKSFSTAVCRVLADADLRHSLSAAGRALVERSYSWSHAVRGLEGLYDVVRRSPRGAAT